MSRKSPTTGQILAARKRRGFTQAQAAKAVGVSLRTWINWEGGDTAMAPDFFSKLLAIDTDASERKAKAIDALVCAALNLLDEELSDEERHVGGEIYDLCNRLEAMQEDDLEKTQEAS